MCITVNEAALGKRWMKLTVHYYSKPRADIDNPAPNALYEFDPLTKDVYLHGKW